MEEVIQNGQLSVVEEPVFENEELDTTKLVANAESDFDFNDYYKRNTATKVKPISKEKRKKRNKMVKASRRKNRR